MQVLNPQPRIILARSVLVVLQEAMASTVRLVPDSQPSIGGILLGKRLSPKEIAILAASTPGPTPDNHQLGFALDSEHANATLESWVARDATVDFLGLWHTYRGDLAQPTASDVEVAHKLVVDPTYNTVEVVNLIVQVDQPTPRIRCFYLHRDAVGQGDAVSFVPYDVLDDNEPLLRGQGVEEAPSPSVSAGAVLSNVATPTPAVARRITVRGAALLSLLVVLLLGGLALARRQTSRTSGSTTDKQQTSVSGTSVSSGIAVQATPPIDATPLASSVATLTSAAVTAITPSAVPTPSTLAVPSASITATSSPALLPATPSQVATSTVSSRLPYVLQFAPMDAAYRRGFLNRLRIANCADCYNIDLVSPVPFREMRIKIAGSPAPPVSNYTAPSPIQLPPRTRPYTLQAFDLQGNPLSEPLTFTVANGTLYVLRITPAPQ